MTDIQPNKYQKLELKSLEKHSKKYLGKHIMLAKGEYDEIVTLVQKAVLNNYWEGFRDNGTDTLSQYCSVENQEVISKAIARSKEQMLASSMF